MLRSEFECLTGFYPSTEMYEAIEAAYLDYGGDKQQFCEDYKRNLDGLAAGIQREADRRRAVKAEEAADMQKRLENYERKLQELADRLESEQEWREWDNGDNYPQEDYEELSRCPGVEVLTEDGAKQMLYRDHGFAPDKVTILSHVPRWEKNRHGALRKNGVFDRKPLHMAQDYSYIRFDAGRDRYELIDGELHAYVE